jgi:hypothetical protein
METGTQSRILELAAEIQHRTQCLHDCLVTDGQPLSSFELDTPPALKLSLEGQAHQDALFEAMHELQALILGRVPYIFNRALESVSALENIFKIMGLKPKLKSFPRSTAS